MTEIQPITKDQLTQAMVDYWRFRITWTEYQAWWTRWYAVEDITFPRAQAIDQVFPLFNPEDLRK